MERVDARGDARVATRACPWCARCSLSRCFEQSGARPRARLEWRPENDRARRCSLVNAASCVSRDAVRGSRFAIRRSRVSVSDASNASPRFDRARSGRRGDAEAFGRGRRGTVGAGFGERFDFFWSGASLRSNDFSPCFAVCAPPSGAPGPPPPHPRASRRACSRARRLERVRPLAHPRRRPRGASVRAFLGDGALRPLAPTRFACWAARCGPSAGPTTLPRPPRPRPRSPLGAARSLSSPSSPTGLAPAERFPGVLRPHRAVSAPPSRASSPFAPRASRSTRTPRVARLCADGGGGLSHALVEHCGWPSSRAAPSTTGRCAGSWCRPAASGTSATTRGASCSGGCRSQRCALERRALAA